MRPPTPNDFPQIIARVVAANPGQTIAELRRSTGAFAGELDRTLYAVELRNGRLCPRTRRKKSAASPGFWSRLRAVFAP